MRKENHVIKFLQPSETAALFDEIEKDRSIHSIRNKAIFKLALYCALRVSEIGIIEMSAYDPVNHTIFCRRLKGSCNNTLRIIDPDVIHALSDWITVRNFMINKKGESPYMFISQAGSPISRKTLDTMMKKYGKAANIPIDKRHFHVLKHTRAIELGEAGFDLKDIQYWLGHKNINNTYIYFQYTTSQQQRLYDMLLLRYNDIGYRP